MLLSDAQAMFVGGTPVERVYFGSEMVWENDPTLLTFTTTGATFSPFVELHSGAEATVQWLDDGGAVLASGLTPVIDFGSAATRQVTMSVDEPTAVRVLSIGFNNADDQGKDSLPASYNKSPEAVVGIDGLQYLPALYAFMAAHTPLTGHLNLSGCAALEYVECFNSNVESVDLTGCTSMRRLVLELTRLTYLDLNPVAPTLRDLRAASQQGGALTLAPQTVPFDNLWHFCVRRQDLTNLPSYDMLPVVEQFWAWYTGISGPLKVFSEAVLNSVQLSSGSGLGTLNTITSLDLTNNVWGGGATNLYAYGMPTLTSIDMSGCTGLVSDIRLQNSGLTTLNLGAITSNSLDLRNNNFLTPAIDAILTTVEGWGTSGGTLDLTGNLPPSVDTGAPLIAALQGRGWTVLAPEPANPAEVYWEDTFDRPDGPLTTPWQPAIGGGAGAVSGNRLVYSGGSSFQRLWATPPEITANDNFEVEIEFDGTPSTMGNYGFLFKMSPDGTGCKFFIRSDQTARLDATMTGAGTAPTTEGGFPASWSESGTHTMMVRVQDTNAQVFLDGHYAFRRSSSSWTSAPGTGVGFCGELPGKTWNRITARSL